MAHKNKQESPALPPLLLGAHMSISGGVHKAINRGESIGCTAIQIFLKNNNRWVSKPYTPEEIAAFPLSLAESHIGAVFAHDCYLVNLGSNKDDIFEKSVACMADDLERCAQIGVPFVVMHPGSHLGEGEDWGLQRVIEGVNEVFARTPGSKAGIAFETTAGQGTNLGSKFEHLATLLAGVRESARAGVCMDTCHMFSAGYELRDPADYSATMSHFDDVVGLNHLWAIHLNDSKKPFGSRVDRHEHIGKGSLGLEPFRNLLNDPRMRAIPMTLETPKGEDMAEDVENLAILRGLVRDTASK